MEANLMLLKEQLPLLTKQDLEDLIAAAQKIIQSKQPPKPPKRKLLEGLKSLPLPVSQCNINRDFIYDERI